MTGSQQTGNGVPAGIRTDIPHPARVYDYWLGGKDNFEIDRKAATEALKRVPEFLDYARGNRQFLVRAVRFLSEAGIRQFLDIGTGFPTSPNVHEIAQSADPDTHVVYVDNDPVVFLHAEALMAKNDGTSVIRADMRDVNEVLRQAGESLDFSEPVALMFVACLHHITDDDDPAGIVARYLDRMAPGSYLVISHFTDDFHPEKVRRSAIEAERAGLTFVPRGRDAIHRLFNDRPLLDPGLVLVTYWRPDGDPVPNANRAWAYGGIARASGGPGVT